MTVQYPHLRFVQVIDEADRLLAQSFQDWLVHVLAATRSTQAVDINSQGGETLWGDLPIADAVAPALLCSLPSDIPTFVTDKRESSCQKLLFSATLTRDPGKIAALELRDPKYFVIQGSKNIDTEESGVLDVVMEKFSMPSTLTVLPIASFHSYILTQPLSGTYGYMRLFSKTSHVVPSRAYTWCNKCSRIHKVS